MNTQQTYSQLQGKPKINYFTALATAKRLIERAIEAMDNNPDNNWKKEGMVLNQYLLTLTEYTRDWMSCAVGNQCDIIPRTAAGWPLDETLEELGLLFNRQIINLYERSTLEDKLLILESASTTLWTIEEEAARVIKETLAKKQEENEQDI